MGGEGGAGRMTIGGNQEGGQGAGGSRAHANYVKTVRPWSGRGNQKRAKYHQITHQITHQIIRS